MKDLVIQIQLWKKWLDSMKIGKTLQLIKLLYGLKIGIQDKLQIDMLREKWRKKTRNKELKKRRHTLKQ